MNSQSVNDNKKQDIDWKSHGLSLVFGVAMGLSVPLAIAGVFIGGTLGFMGLTMLTASPAVGFVGGTAAATGMGYLGYKGIKALFNFSKKETENFKPLTYYTAAVLTALMPMGSADVDVQYTAANGANDGAYSQDLYQNANNNSASDFLESQGRYQLNQPRLAIA
jgi:hypothetical protein